MPRANPPPPSSNCPAICCAAKQPPKGIWYNVGVFKMCMMDEIRAKRDEIYAIARKHKAKKLWVFGLCVRREVPT